MASSAGVSPRASDTGNSLEKIKRQLASGSGRNLLQGPLLKRSETLKKWNERWVILDPTTGKMEYKTKRTEAVMKGTIIFDGNSTIAISPVNFHGLLKYDGCCFYIGTPQRKDYFLCAETPGAARAWVSTLHATQLVLKAHKDAVDSLSGAGSARLGTIATVVAAANSTAQECSKEIEAAMKISMKKALGSLAARVTDGPMDDLTIMKETLRVKDEELQNLARDLRARDSTIKEIAERLSDTAQAAEIAASAVHTIDEQRRTVSAEIVRLRAECEKQHESSMLKLKELEEKVTSLSKERDELIKQRDSAVQEANLWRSELAKARDRAIILEGAAVRAEEKLRVTEAEAGCRLKEAELRESNSIKEKHELLAYISMLQAQLQRQHIETHQVVENTESHSEPAMAKHMDPSQQDEDKACLIESKPRQVHEESIVDVSEDQVPQPRSISINQSSDFEVAGSSPAYVRDIAPETEGESLDIIEVTPLDSLSDEEAPSSSHHHS
uniref:PH domain-containing protein n=1 Tax=Kalanchoe fedtschenkoi TaxID=63787 RepID=A0A7N0ZYD9_KALFE